MAARPLAGTFGAGVELPELRDIRSEASSRSASAASRASLLSRNPGLLLGGQLREQFLLLGNEAIDRLLLRREHRFDRCLPGEFLVHDQPLLFQLLALGRHGVELLGLLGRVGVDHGAAGEKVVGVISQHGLHSRVQTAGSISRGSEPAHVRGELLDPGLLALRVVFGRRQPALDLGESLGGRVVALACFFRLAVQFVDSTLDFGERGLRIRTHRGAQRQPAHDGDDADGGDCGEFRACSTGSAELLGQGARPLFRYRLPG